MNDIVEAMRYCASVSDGSKCAECEYGMRTDGDCVEGLLSEAADEIEFLSKVIEVERKEHKEALEAELKKHEWISVKERLPEETGLYAVTVFNEVENEVFVSDSVFYEGRWVERNGDGLKITHWMPLPVQPKGEEE